MKRAIELVRTVPGCYKERQAIILALCTGLEVVDNRTPEKVGSFIMRVANTILEESHL